MGAEQEQHGTWRRIYDLAMSLKSPHEDKVFVGKDYTKRQLREDLLATIPLGYAPEPEDG